MDWNHKLKQLMGEATHLVRSGNLADATRAIQQALGHNTAAATPRGAGTPEGQAVGTTPVQTPVPAATFRTSTAWRGAAAPDVEDAVVIEREGGPAHDSTDGSKTGAQGEPAASRPAAPSSAAPGLASRAGPAAHAEPPAASPAWPSLAPARRRPRTTTTCTFHRVPRPAPPCRWC